MNMRKKISTVIGLAVLSLVTWVQAAQAPAKIKVLLVTGDDVMPSHNWRETSQATREVLENSGKFEVKLCEDAAILESAATLKNYDLVYLAIYNAKTPTLTDGAKENLANFVKSGRGFAVAHLASASFKEWPEFKKLCGRYWVMGKSGHGPRSTFAVKLVDKANPITKGLQDFVTDDELYAKLEGDAPIEVLATADSDWSNKTEPLAFTLKYGSGRVFHQAFGHDRKAIIYGPVAQIIARGCEWAAKGSVEQ